MVISPAMTTRPVAVRVSQATRLYGIFGQAGVENGVGNLVGDLVGMAFGHGFGRKKITVLGWQWCVSLRLHWAEGHRASRYEPGFNTLILKIVG